MNRSLIFLLLLTIGIVGITKQQARADLIIAQQGKSTFTIVIPKKPPSSVVDAANELQRSIAESTGAKLPIEKDNGNIANPVISLGKTEFSREAGVTSEDIADSGFRLITKEGNLYIIGLDTVAKVEVSRHDYGKMTPQPDIPGPQYTEDGGWSHGTANGVYTFLEDYLGVRWLMPGELGRDVPSKSTFVIPDIDRQEEPEFIYRRPHFLEKYRQPIQEIHDWQFRQKLGFSFRLNGGHNWEKTIPAKLYETHPEWFAMVDGKRLPPKEAVSGRYKLETTNQDLVKYYAKQAVDALKNAPSMNTYSLSPTDGSYSWSESPESKALFDPPPPGSKRPSRTPLILKWYTDVSNTVAQEYPQGKLAGFIYASYLYPPQKEKAKLPENFTPYIAPSINYGFHLYREKTREEFDYLMKNWAEVAPSTWFYFDLPNVLEYADSTGLVTPPAIGILKFIFPRLLESHIKGANLYGTLNWSGSALTTYINSKLLWNPRLDPDDVMHEWLMRAYGPEAGPVMENFYAELDSWFESFYQEHDLSEWRVKESMYEHLYAPNYERMEQLLLQAEQQQMTSAQKDRLNLIKDNLILLRWKLTNAGYIPNDAASTLKRDSKDIEGLMFDKGEPRKVSDGAFDLFPVAWFRNQTPRKWVDVRFDQAPQKASTQDIPNEGYILLYPTKNKKISVKVDDVNAGSALAGYRVYGPHPRKDNDYAMIQQGLFYQGQEITFDAESDAPYLLRVTTYGLASPQLNYTFSIPQASVAKGSFADGTLYLQKENTSLYVSVPEELNLSDISEGENVKLTTQTPIEAARLKALDKYAGAKVLLKLDEKWKFKTDPNRSGLDEDIIDPDYKDASWKTLDATDTWQSQGFSDYHGVAWYRKNFTLSKSGEKVLLFFGAVDGDAVVYINGEKVGEHSIGSDGGKWDEPFAIDVTDSLVTGNNNVAVQVTKESHASGIFRGVSLLGVGQ